MMAPEELDRLVKWIAAAVEAPERIREMAAKGAGLGTTRTGDGIIAALVVQAAAAGVPMASGVPMAAGNLIPVRSAVIIAALALETGVALGRGYEAYVRETGELERMMRGG